MSLSFNCGQYEQAFNSLRLQNWELRNKRRKRPKAMEGFTTVIANDHGHLLPSMPRSTRSPWGTYVGTWDLPKQLPGTKVTDPMARSANAHHKNLAIKGEADVIIYGQHKLRRPMAGQPIEAMAESIPTYQTEARPSSEKSGRQNALVKGCKNSPSPAVLPPIKSPAPQLEEPIHPELTKSPPPRVPSAVKQ